MLQRTRGENITQHVPLKSIRTSSFDLSHDHKTSFALGELIPHLTLPLLPSDSVSVSCQILMRFPKLFFPIMHRVETHVAYFFVPNDVIWDKWKAFIKPDFTLGGVDITPVTAPTINVTFALDQDGIDLQRKRIIEYMGFPTPQTPPGDGAWNTQGIDINALPIAAYWQIWNDYYRRPQTQYAFGTDEWESEPPILRGADTDFDYTTVMDNHYLLFRQINDTVDGSQKGWLNVQKRNWNPDLFTMATYEPQYGAEVLVPMVADPDDPKTWPSNWYAGGGTQSVGAMTQDGTAPNRRTRVNNLDHYLDVQSTAATIASFRYAEAMQAFLERLNRVGDRYRDVIRGFYGVDPSPFADDYAVYIGSVTGQTIISDVMTTAEFTVTQPQGKGVGSYAGKIVALENTPTYQYQAKEHGWLIGIVNVQPTSSYFEGANHFWFWQTWEDIPFDEFAHVGDEELKWKEVYLDYGIAPDHADHDLTWGYIPRYQRWRYQNDVVSGYLRTSYNSMHLGRTFKGANKEQEHLSFDFLQCNPEDSRVFEITKNGDDVVFAQIWNQVRVIRQLPKYGIPMGAVN